MGETLYKVKIKATFKINLNVAFNMSECYKKDTFIHSGNKMSSFESLTGNHTNWQRQGCQIIYHFPPSTITELL